MARGARRAADDRVLRVQHSGGRHRPRRLSGVSEAVARKDRRGGRAVSSFAGSGTITNQLILGVPGELALLSLELDADKLAERGVVAAGSWRRFPFGGVVNRTPFIILVRRGNPEEHPRLRGPGEARRARGAPRPFDLGRRQLGDRGGIRRGRAERAADPARAGHDLLLGIWKNVVAQAASARAARTQFENGFGDALITYEQEALWDLARGRLNADVVYPRSTMLSEHTLVRIDRNIRRRERDLVDAFAAFLWSEEAQRIVRQVWFPQRERAVEPGEHGLRRDRGPVPDRGPGRMEAREERDRGFRLEGPRPGGAEEMKALRSGRGSSRLSGQPAPPRAPAAAPHAARRGLRVRPEGGTARVLGRDPRSRGAVRPAVLPPDRVRDHGDQRGARHVHGLRSLQAPFLGGPHAGSRREPARGHPDGRRGDFAASALGTHRAARKAPGSARAPADVPPGRSAARAPLRDVPLHARRRQAGPGRARDDLRGGRLHDRGDAAGRRSVSSCCRPCAEGSSPARS